MRVGAQLCLTFDTGGYRANTRPLNLMELVTALSSLHAKSETRLSSPRWSAIAFRVRSFNHERTVTVTTVDVVPIDQYRSDIGLVYKANLKRIFMCHKGEGLSHRVRCTIKARALNFGTMCHTSTAPSSVVRSHTIPMSFVCPCFAFFRRTAKSTASRVARAAGASSSSSCGCHSSRSPTCE